MTAETFEGEVTRIRFRSLENGFVVLRLNSAQHGEITAVGQLPEVHAGQRLRLTGRWGSHPVYGRQFLVEHAEGVLPKSSAGILAYLGSGLVKGVGPATAARIVGVFGEDTLRVIAEEPDKLKRVRGLGAMRAREMQNAVLAQAHVQDVMVFLREHEIPSGAASRIFRQYGRNSVAILKDNPYRLADEVFGIGFRTADQIAHRLGFAEDAPVRLKAALVYALSLARRDGHVFLPEEELERAMEGLLGFWCAPAEVAKSLSPQEVVVDARGYYLPELYQAEQQCAQLLAARLAASAGPAPRSGPQNGLLSADQQRAVEAALTHGVLIVTGGPGTGKTTVVRHILAELQKRHDRALLAAPTGRAAKRLAEVAGQSAMTLHRLLGYGVDGRAKPSAAPGSLRAGALIVDEVSMLDLVLFRELLVALAPETRLILVGDADQLPSVGVGQVMGDLVSSGVVPTVRLTEIFRQAAESPIVLNAHRINQGQWPVFTGPDGLFGHVLAEDPEDIARQVVRQVAQVLPQHGLDPLEDIGVLSPGHRAACGVEALNQMLQETLNPPVPGEPQITMRGRAVRAGDKVLQTRNNYGLGVFNGDVGRVERLDAERQQLVALFADGDGPREVTYEAADLRDLELGYALSVHKAQGSEYQAVVMVLSSAHFVLLDRSLFYTAITRAKQRVVLVGSSKALSMAIGRVHTRQRHSALGSKLQAEGTRGPELRKETDG